MRVARSPNPGPFECLHLEHPAGADGPAARGFAGRNQGPGSFSFSPARGGGPSRIRCRGRATGIVVSTSRGDGAVRLVTERPAADSGPSAASSSRASSSATLTCREDRWAGRAAVSSTATRLDNCRSRR